MQFEPKVDPAHEFLEIASDFTNPLDIVREAVSNAFDAHANVIKVTAYMDRSSGLDEMVIVLVDDGEGMTDEVLENFFGLGRSTRRERNERGYKVGGAIGEKGHGTKIYFNSRRIEVVSIHDGKRISAFMDEPKRTLRRGCMPIVQFDLSDVGEPNGTKITIYGYNDNNQAGFDHESLKDYVLWFTKFGSFEKELGLSTLDNVVLHLKGLGHSADTPERLSFGHKFPQENTNLATLKKTDKVAPLDYYVARWIFPQVKVDGMPSSTIDVVFSLEGDQAKRAYNPMIHQKYAAWKPGEYNVEERYGLWLAKDYIPIDRRNRWVAEKSEWTKYHAFVNCQDFRLTANRSNLDNTPPDLLESVEKTVQRIFRESIMPAPEYRKYQQEFELQQLYRSAEAEEQDFLRRKKSTLAQKVAKFKDTLFIEPRQEGGVFSIVMQLLTLQPDIFGFKVVDYDTAFGYDLLVTKDLALDLNRAALRFVEMKYELKRDFSHSFKNLAAVICWDTRLANQDEVIDLSGKKRIMRITPQSEDEQLQYTKFMLITDTEDHNIEVYVLKEFLKEKLGLDFKARSKE